MNFQNILVPVAILGLSLLAYRIYGWPGVAVVITLVVFAGLLHFNRLMDVLRRAAGRPIGYVDSAVMLNAKLKPGMTLMHVVAMTRSLGQQLSEKNVQPEVFRWHDGGESLVRCTFVGGKLSHYELSRPASEAD